MMNEWLNNIVADISAQDFDTASGIVVDLTTVYGHTELIGPFPKDTVEAFDVIEFLRSEEDPEAEPNTYAVRLLFPPTFAQIPS